ncbi:MAG: hypothetical protein ABL934_06035 [Lysobacteraceae bacterium]
MKKGVVIALCVAVLAVGAGGAWWWAGRDRVSSSPAAVAPKTALTPAERAERAERIKQAIAHRRHLWREASYIEIRQAAIDGDLVAQRRLSEAYEDCRAFDGNLKSTMPFLSNLAQSDPNFAPTVSAILKDKRRLCVQAAFDLAKNPAAAEYWLHKSAKSGDVVSEMRYFGRSVPNLSHSQFQYFIDKARETGDPDAIFELSVLLSKLDGRWPDPIQAPAFETGAEQAWIVVACRAGYDCDRGSRLMNLICLNTFSCTKLNFEAYLSELSTDPALRAGLRQLQVLIEGTILKPKAK